MSIELLVSNSLTVLGQQLTKRMALASKTAFQPEWIVTQTEGMNNWLKLTLASGLGISANIHFCSPDDIVSKISYWLKPQGKKVLDKELLLWSIYGILGQESFRSRFPEKSNYYQGSDIRRISLASEMADLFDQYQVYRSGDLSDWKEKKARGVIAEDWQEWVWMQLSEQFSESHIDRVEVKRSIREALHDEIFSSTLARRLPELHVFGLAVVTPYHLEVFYLMSTYIKVHLYLMNPAPGQYWLDNTTERALARKRKYQPAAMATVQEGLLGNELLLNMGRLIRDSFTLLFQDDDIIDQYDPLETPLPDPSTLLKKIQSDIQGNLYGPHRHAIQPTDLSDGSLTITGSYTPLREVEALYNHLVSFIDARSDGISPRDILVQVSDIDLYAPYIKAVFGNATYRIPFSIADQTITSDNNIFSAMHDLLMLDAEKLQAEDVLALLESSYIRERFGITDTDDLRDAVRESGIIFSMQGKREDDSHYISWHHGLQRILYGWCMTGTEMIQENGSLIQPLDSAEGTAAMDRIRLIHFIHVLDHMMKQRAVSRTIAGWAAYLRELMEQMVFAASEKDDDDYPDFISLIEEMSDLDEYLQVEVPFDVFRHSFIHRLKREKRSQGFLGQGITFCSLVPMRSIPFRVIAMLGLDYDKFPRRENVVSFSRLAKGLPRPGDRNIRNNDRHLFLETILSAREMLYISYISRDVKDGSERPPSPLVDELMDYVSKGMETDMDVDELRHLWVKQHPLHSFSQIYFSPNAPFRNYLPEARFGSGIEVRLKEGGKEELVNGDVELHKLVSFFQNPPKAYLQQKLGIRYYDEELLIPSHENFEPDRLQKHLLQQEMLYMTEDQIPQFAFRKSRLNMLPLHNMGTVVAENLFHQSDRIRDEFQAARDGSLSFAVNIDIQLPEGRLFGKVPECYGDDFIFVSLSSAHFKHLIGAYIRYLSLVASGMPIGFVFIAKSIPGQHRIPVGAITKDAASGFLDACVRFYHRGLTDYFRFYPALCREEFSMLKGGAELFLEKMQVCLESEHDYDFADPYLTKAIEHGFFAPEHFEDLKANVIYIMDPIMQSLPSLFAGKNK